MLNLKELQKVANLVLKHVNPDLKAKVVRKGTTTYYHREIQINVSDVKETMVRFDIEDPEYAMFMLLNREIGRYLCRTLHGLRNSEIWYATEGIARAITDAGYRGFSTVYKQFMLNKPRSRFMELLDGAASFLFGRMMGAYAA